MLWLPADPEVYLNCSTLQLQRMHLSSIGSIGTNLPVSRPALEEKQNSESCLLFDILNLNDCDKKYILKEIKGLELEESTLRACTSQLGLFYYRWLFN